ncbi:MAG: hypothetical protein GDA36_05630 [Rhodobacteraceae bacterium]|nr:hypothetical protein [Paracoccaceae bacterium]
MRKRFLQILDTKYLMCLRPPVSGKSVRIPYPSRAEEFGSRPAACQAKLRSKANILELI